MDPESSSRPTSDGEPETGLNFDKAEFAEASDDSLSCMQCSTSIHQTYFEVNGLPVCEYLIGATTLAARTVCLSPGLLAWVAV